MSDRAGEIEIWDPPDAWIASLIRHLRGLSTDEPIPSSLIASWRRHLRTEVVRVGRARAEGRDPYPARGHVRNDAALSVSDVVREMLVSPEARFWIGVMISMPTLLENVARPTAEQVVAVWRAETAERRADRAEISELHRYLDWKFSDEERPFVGAKFGVPGFAAVAAANGCTSTRVLGWRARLADRAEAPAALAEMRDVGREVMAGVPTLGLAGFEPGDPRGIWPDPPPPEPEPSLADEVSQAVIDAVASGETLQYVPGKGGK